MPSARQRTAMILVDREFRSERSAKRMSCRSESIRPTGVDSRLKFDNRMGPNVGAILRCVRDDHRRPKQLTRSVTRRYVDRGRQVAHSTLCRTMTDNYRAALDALAAAGWTVRERTSDTVLSPADVWPAPLRQRYPVIPADLTNFVARVEACVSPDESAWFLSARDYAGTSDAAFAWNEWER